MAEVESLAAYLQGRLSLKDFEWPQSHRPSLSSNTYLHSHLIPEIDLQALLPCERRSEFKPADIYGNSHTASESSAEISNKGYRSEFKPADVYGNSDTAIESSAAVPSKEYTHLIHAATTCGFFQVYNHCVPISALETLYSHARRFFSMPLEHKLEVGKRLGRLNEGNFSTGYMCGSPVYSYKKFWCEALRASSTDRSSISGVAACLWQDEKDQRAFGDAVEACSKGLAKLAAQISLLLLQELVDGDAEEVLRTYITGEHTEGVKLSHYPPCPQPDKISGLPAHSDVHLITLLWQDDVGGLQVQRDGQWINVKPRRDALVVNIGDVLQVWSNDRYKSGVHQAVLNATQSRYSIGYFYNFGEDTTLAPLPQVLKRSGQPPRFKSMAMSEYRRHFFARSFFAASAEVDWQGVDYLRFE